MGNRQWAMGEGRRGGRPERRGAEKAEDMGGKTLTTEHTEHTEKSEKSERRGEA